MTIEFQCYLLILIGCDGGELGFWEGEAEHALGRQRLDLGQVHARVMLDDVHARLVLVHRLKNNLDGEKTKREFQNRRTLTVLLSFVAK